MPGQDSPPTRSGLIGWLTRPPASLAAIWLLGLLAFLPALWGPWLLDDAHIRDSIEAVHASGLRALADGGWQTHLFLGGGGLGRPLAMATVAGNALVSADPFGFKAVNLLLHLIAATLVYALVRTLLRTRYESGTADGAALVVALLWALHPLQVSTVGYVAQRMTILSALFSLAALLLYARLRIGGRGGVLAWLSALCLLPGLAVLSKENGLLVPLYLLALEATMFGLRGTQATRRLLAGYFGLGAALSLGLILLLLLDPQRLLAGYAWRPFDLGDRLLTQTRVVTLYVGQVLLPRLDAMPFFYDGLPPSTGWLTPPATLASALFLAALAGLALALRPHRPLAAFGIALFFAGHLMESTILPMELAFEHRNYLPSLGLLLAGVDLASAATCARPRLVTALGGLAVAAFFALGLIRSVVWSSAEQIALTALAGPWPSQRAHAELAQTLTDQGRLQAARRVLAGAEGLGPRLQEGYLDCLETSRMDPRRLTKARSQLVSYVTDYDASALILVANLALDQTCAIPELDLLALVADAAAVPTMQQSSRQKLWMYAGHLRSGLGDSEGAIAALELAFAASPANPLPLLLAAYWRLDAGDREGAEHLYERAVAVGSPGRLDLSEQFAELKQRIGDSASSDGGPTVSVLGDEVGN